MLAKSISGNGFFVTTTPIHQMIGGKIKETFESIVFLCDPFTHQRSKLIKQKYYDDDVSAEQGHEKLVKEYIHAD